MMTWQLYESRHYPDDIRAFIEAVSGGEMPARLELCDCSAHEATRKAVQDLPAERLPFLLTEIFLEAALLAGVHTFDLGHYSAYADALPQRIFVRSHAYGRFATYHPQVLLLASETWDAVALEVLEDGSRELCRAWAHRYDDLFGIGCGARVLRGCSHR